MNAVELSNIRKRWGGNIALSGVTMGVKAGSILGLVGPNGAGKSTLLNIIAGYIRKYEGDVLIDGHTPGSSGILGITGVFPQDTALPWARNVADLTQFMYTLTRAGQGAEKAVIAEYFDIAAENTAASAVYKALYATGLHEMCEKKVEHLSHGQKGRLTLSLAFTACAGLLLLDEPAAGLDPAAARNIRELIKNLRGKVTIIISSHDLATLEGLCTHIAFLHKGIIRRFGRADEIMSVNSHIRYMLHVPAYKEVFQDLPGLISMQIDETGCELSAEIDSDVISTAEFNKVALPRILENGVISVRTGRPLEEAYMLENS